MMLIFLTGFLTVIWYDNNRGVVYVLLVKVMSH